jgi:hypothetical protein
LGKRKFFAIAQKDSQLGCLDCLWVSLASDVLRAWPLRPFANVEADGLAFSQLIERSARTRGTMKEVLDAAVGGDLQRFLRFSPDMCSASCPFVVRGSHAAFVRTRLGYDHAIATSSLRRIQRRIGRTEQGLPFGIVLGHGPPRPPLDHVAGYADADRQRSGGKGHASQHRRAATHRAPQIVGNVAGPRLRAPGHSDHELVAAVPAGNRILRETGRDDVANSADRLRPRQMPMRIIQGLQPVQIEDEQGVFENHITQRGFAQWSRP